MTETPTAEELLKKIQKLEQDHRHLKEKIISISDHKSNRVTESEYVNILQSMGQSVHMFNLKNRIIYWNLMAENLFGYTVEEALGKTATDLIIGPTYADIAALAMQRVFKGETWSGQFPVRNKYCETFNVITTLTPFRDQNGTIIGVICVCTDARQFLPRSTADAPSHDQPLQYAIVSKITNWASMVKMKIKTNNSSIMDHNSSTANYHDRSENKVRHHKVLPEAWMGKKGNHSDVRPTPFSFGWPWLQEKTSSSSIAYSKVKSQVYENPCEIRETPGSSWSYSSSNSVDLYIENSDVEISWDDLIIREQIGQRSCGTVYRALLYGSDVAVKIFNKQDYADVGVIQSFRKEVCLMKRLRYPNILLFMGAVVSPPHLCIVTEFLPRGSLLRLLQRSTTNLDWRRRVRMAVDIARGMNYLHCCQPPILHRDLKSSNLLVDKNWTLKVGDFGLSRVKHETYLAKTIATGTPQWMAPEVLRNEQVDEKSDVYSYGVVLWEITTRRIPWENLNSMQVIRAVGFMNQQLELPIDIDPQWASLIESCWSREPQSRPTFQVILFKLQELQKKFKIQFQGPEGIKI